MSDRIIGRLTKINCSGSHWEKLGFTNIVPQKGESIVYINEEGRRIETGEKVTTTDYDESDSDAIIINNKYILIW
ncbi:MAG: hypothetical protein HFJ33_06165 [Clostridia bacterium]|nr:hypothetical protein [Clostridia bacterium]